MAVTYEPVNRRLCQVTISYITKLGVRLSAEPCGSVVTMKLHTTVVSKPSQPMNSLLAISRRLKEAKVPPKHLAPIQVYAAWRTIPAR
jgi:hypothetical protein